MRFMIEFSIPTPYGNEVVRSGKIDKVFKGLIEDFKPEAIYFYPSSGVRGGCFFIQSNDPALCVAVGERLWFGLQAHVTIKPVLNGEELGKGLAEIGKIMERFA